MADLLFLRFLDPASFGHSRFRPSEGWIDVDEIRDSEGVFDGKAPGEFSVKCANDPVGPSLFQASGTGKRFQRVELLVSIGSFRFRYKMTDVFLASASVGPDAHLSLTLRYDTVNRNLE